MIAFVTGATGFIGSYLVETLLQRNLQVRAFVRPTSNLRWIKSLPVELSFGDLREGHFPRDVLKGVDYVFHLAGVIDAPSKKDYFQINAEGTRFLIERMAGIQPHLKKFILVSSQAAGGPSVEGKAVREDDPPHPVSFYGESKLAGERAVLDFNGKLPVVILRPPTIYGPRDDRVLKAFQMMKRGFALAAGLKPKFISFCYVDDLIEALLLAAFQSRSNGRIYNVCGPRPYEWLEFIEAIGRAMQCPYRIFRIPGPLLFLLGAGGEIYTRLSRRPTLFTWQKVKEFVQNSWVIDGERIRQELGWEERVSLPDGMAKTVEWYRREGWL